MRCHPSRVRCEVRGATPAGARPHPSRRPPRPACPVPSGGCSARLPEDWGASAPHLIADPHIHHRPRQGLAQGGLVSILTALSLPRPPSSGSFPPRALTGVHRGCCEAPQCEPGSEEQSNPLGHLGMGGTCDRVGSCASRSQLCPRSGQFPPYTSAQHLFANGAPALEQI